MRKLHICRGQGLPAAVWKPLVCTLALLAALTVPARAAELPEELTDALPKQAEEVLEAGDLSGPEGLSAGPPTAILFILG